MSTRSSAAKVWLTSVVRSILNSSRSSKSLLLPLLSTPLSSAASRASGFTPKSHSLWPFSFLEVVLAGGGGGLLDLDHAVSLFSSLLPAAGTLVGGGGGATEGFTTLLVGTGFAAVLPSGCESRRFRTFFVTTMPLLDSLEGSLDAADFLLTRRVEVDAVTKVFFTLDRSDRDDFVDSGVEVRGDGDRDSTGLCVSSSCISPKSSTRRLGELS